MPAKNLHRVDKESTYCHIYNKGVEKRTIFADEPDFEVFLGYLNEYLTTPQDPESVKKDFTIKGRAFRGTPHMPKNYFNEVEVVAYSLMPDHFHLLLHQKSKGAIERFIRSLCTRYSMYFNKKYERGGALFEGPYKSVQVNDASGLLHLTRYLHGEATDYSSYPEYLGQRQTPWVKPEAVLAYFDKAEISSLRGVNGYENFVEKYEPDAGEQELLAQVTLENGARQLERRILVQNPEETPLKEAEPQFLPPMARLPEIAAISAVFLMLFGFGLKNIGTTTAKGFSLPAVMAPQVLSESTEAVSPPEPTPAPEPKKTVTVKITDGAAAVNIRQNPTVRSEKVGEAKDGEVFEFVSLNSNWYEIKLADGSNAFILASYAHLGGDK